MRKTSLRTLAWATVLDVRRPHGSTRVRSYRVCDPFCRSAGEARGVCVPIPDSQRPHHWNAAPKAFVGTESLLLGVGSWEKFAPYAVVVISLVSLSSGILENPLLFLLYL